MSMLLVSDYEICSTLLPFCVPLGPVLQGGGPQCAAALAPDLQVAGVTALVPAQTPPDRRVS